jgi:hypothetical protein
VAFSQPTEGWPTYEYVMSFMEDGQTTPHQINVKYVLENFAPATIELADAFFQRFLDHLEAFDPGEGQKNVYAQKTASLISYVTATPEG